MAIASADTPSPVRIFSLFDNRSSSARGSRHYYIVSLPAYFRRTRIHMAKLTLYF
jgi:hypothetical protein